MLYLVLIAVCKNIRLYITTILIGVIIITITYVSKLLEFGPVLTEGRIGLWRMVTYWS